MLYGRRCQALRPGLLLLQRFWTKSYKTQQLFMPLSKASSIWCGSRRICPWRVSSIVRLDTGEMALVLQLGQSNMSSSIAAQSQNPLWTIFAAPKIITSSLTIYTLSSTSGFSFYFTYLPGLPACSGTVPLHSMSHPHHRRK